MRIYGLSDDGNQEVLLFESTDTQTTFDATRLTFTRYRIQNSRTAVCYEGVTLNMAPGDFSPPPIEAGG